MSTRSKEILKQTDREENNEILVAGIHLLPPSIYCYRWNVLMPVKPVAKAVNGLMTPYTEWCGIKAIQYDLVLSTISIK